MNAIYAVWTRSAEMHSEDGSILIGVYTTRTLALDVGRRSLGHEEDEYYIREHFLNQFGPGETIWDNHCDKEPETHAGFYRRFWRAGFPLPIN